MPDVRSGSHIIRVYKSVLNIWLVKAIDYIINSKQIYNFVHNWLIVLRNFTLVTNGSYPCGFTMSYTEITLNLKIVTLSPL